MSTEPKTYRAHRRGQSHTGTSGFTNHWPGTREDIAQALKVVFADHPGTVVLDGNDDWYAPQCDRPEVYRRHFDGLEPVAFFHSRISGMSVSGIVVTREDFERLEREFPSKTWTQIDKPDRTGCQLRDCVRVYESPLEV
jgi:hypothetical protein